MKYYLSKGLILTKVHRVIGFSPSKWLKPYIDFNTEKRRLAKNNFEKDLFKLLNNSIFGKTIENLRKSVHVELVHTSKRLRKVCAKPNFQTFKIFNDDLVAVNMKNVNIVLNRLIYAGFCILDISKVFMYQFHYDFVKPKYDQRARLHLTDTDSLSYEIETNDWYKDMLENQVLFDTTNFAKDHTLYNNKHCKALGKFRYECGGKIIEQFVVLRPKMYSLKYGDKQESWKAKGIKKCVVEKQMKHSMYVECLEKQYALRSKKL
ncbi:uncharacterized protein LOC128550985 [Mercenaria mercenaria]|uniref:uncharacterized protein LOC128550985 n=1 Tax=Mercenaria mercenaria TaxID=6596 RepID=UPI00234EDC2F|nr:uncharacterized protein LOC128550985 [Mercenaria mercenaria]